MVIIAFAPNSKKILPRIFCKNFKHCAVLVRTAGGFRMYQFTSHGHVADIFIRIHDIKILGAYGWRFFYMPRNINANFNPYTAWTCVGMAKRAIGMHAPLIQTPDALYKKLSD